MRPHAVFLWPLVLALVLPAVASPAGAAVVYVPAECQQVPPDVPEGCPGVSVGDPMGTPPNECIHPFTNFVFDCVNPRQPIGTGLPTTYIWTDAESSMSNVDCLARGVQWCVQFGVAATGHVPVTLYGVLESEPIRVVAIIRDWCSPLHAVVYTHDERYDTVAEWHETIARNSQCGPNFAAFVESTVTVTNADTGAFMFEARDEAFYGPPRYFWPGSGACDSTDRVSCKLFRDTNP